MSTLRAIIVASLLIVLVAVLLPIQAVAVWCGFALQRRLPHLFHRLACRLIGLRIRIAGTPPRGATTLIVANHSSWIDIPAIAATLPVVFIAKREVSSWPLFGLLARLQRAIFVDRQRRSATGRTNDEIARRLIAGDHVVLFAEGTSSDGNRVLPFKSALIGAAGDALARDGGRPHIVVQPLSLAYTHLDGMPLSRHDRCHVAWYGAMPLLPHLARVLRKGAIDLTLTFGEPVLYRPDSDRKAVTRALETTVRDITTATLRAA